jgi:hypothetical protein
MFPNGMEILLSSRTNMFNQRRENHLRSTSYNMPDNNRERHLKHPACSVNTVRQYRQTLNIKRSYPRTIFDKVLSWFNI